MLYIDLWRIRQNDRRFAVDVSCCRHFYFCANFCFSLSQFYQRYLGQLHKVRVVQLLCVVFLLSILSVSALAASANGNVRIQLINGTVAGFEPLANTAVTVQSIRADGQGLWFGTAASDHYGMVDLQLADISPFQPYRIVVESPSNQDRKMSPIFTVAGDYEFVVGNPPLEVSLIDAKHQSALANVEISAFLVAVDGSKKWHSSHVTDENGQLIFDLDGLGQGRVYQLHTEVYNQFTHVTESVTDAGQLTIVVGDTQVRLFNGSVVEQPPLADVAVTVHRMSEDGELLYCCEAVTDAEGWLRLNLNAISPQRPYQLSLNNPTTGQLLYSPILTKNGEHQLVMGNLPLAVSLLDSLHQHGIANKRVEVHKRLNDGRYVWFMEKLTDNQGQLLLDLPGLAIGSEVYRLTTKAFDGIGFDSIDIRSVDPVIWSVGNTQLQVFNGSLPKMPVYADVNVALYQLIDGERVWLDSANSDDNGMIRFDLQPDGRYQFHVNSPINGKSWFSEVVEQAGYHQFVVGNPEVLVRLSNRLNGQWYDNEMLNAYKLTDSGQKQWYSSQLTDDMGVARFDLAGIEQGERYVFEASLFSSGSVYSQPISSAQLLDFTVGAVPVTLVDIDSQLPLQQKLVAAYLLSDGGELTWLAEGFTDHLGVITFDFAQFNGAASEVARVIFKAHNPFEQSNEYHGPIISDVGAVDFYIKRGIYGDVDLQPPNITISSPASDVANVSGFRLTGLVADDVAVSKVVVEITNSEQSRLLLVANLADNLQSWFVDVPNDWLVDQHAVDVVVTAFDLSLNQSSVTRRYLLAEDSTPPNIVVSSHQANDSVNANGFMVSGYVTDDIEVGAIFASLSDPLLGDTVVAQPLDISASGQWELLITSGKVSPQQTFHLTFTATDLQQRQSRVSLDLQAVSITQDPIHLAQRMTFGLTPELLAHIKSGIDYLDEQLNPELIDDSDFERQMANMMVKNKTDLKNYLLRYMLGSQKQLQEVMAWFWENHFNTNLNSHGFVRYELAENKQFRQLALGRFRDLLAASAKSPAMIHYLNNQQNVIGRANENYAREIMELHTLGVNGGYSATDVAELAKIFTGWHEQNGEFDFDAAKHDYSDKQFLGHSILGAGVAEGEQVLDILAAHPATADYLCGKLVALLVSDFALPKLQRQCAAEYLASFGDIKAVVRVILTSDQFMASDHYRSKVKTPLELVLATSRGFASGNDVSKLNEQLATMGMNLFEFSVPTGFAEHSHDWLSSHGMMQRIAMLSASSEQSLFGFQINFKQLLLGHQMITAEAALSYLFELALGNEFTALEYQLGLDILHDTTGFNIYSDDADEKLNRLLGTVLSFPSFNYQ